MIKKLVVAFLILSFSVYGALIDSEDFESYTPMSATYDNPNTLFFNESQGKWGCKNMVDYPHCSAYNPQNAYLSGYSIFEYGNNNYLMIYTDAEGGTHALNTTTVQLRWNHTNHTITTEDYITVKLDLKVAWIENDTYAINDIYEFGGIRSNYYFRYGFMGGHYNVNAFSTEHFNNFTQFRHDLFTMGGAGSFKPDIGCQLHNGKWNTITLQYTLDSGKNSINHTEVYKDNTLCYESDIVYAVSSDTLVNLDFEVWRNWALLFDNIEIYTGLVSPSEYTETADLRLFQQCPYQNCIFYDDFKYYENGYNLSRSGYYGDDDYNIIDDDNLIYINDGKIGHDLNTSVNYDSVQNNFILSSNNTQTNNNIENNTLAYVFKDYCTNGAKVSEVYILFDTYKNDSSLYTGYETAINFFIKDNSLIPIGSFIVPNGENYGFSRIYDYSENKYFFNVYTNDNYEEGILPNTIDTEFTFSAPCPKLSYFEIEKIGDSNVTNFYSIIELSYLGGLDSEDTDFNYEYTNKTNESTAGVVEGEIGEHTHNFAYSLGFKKSSSKLVFWVLVLVAFMIGIYANKTVPKEGKYFATVVLTCIWLLSGWYWGFVPTVVFIFLIVVVVLAVAYTVTHLLRSGQDFNS